MHTVKSSPERADTLLGKLDKYQALFLSILLVLTTAAWLVPNHYPPWLSAWNDALAISGLLLSVPLAAMGAGRSVGLAWRLPVITALCGTTALLQLLSGKLLFAGDAVMVILYGAVWLLAVLTGRMIASELAPKRHLDTLMSAWLLVALISVGIAMVQWTGALTLNIYAADLPPGTRPFGNVAQANNFCTLCFLGFCALLWLHQTQKVSNSVFLLGAGFLLFGIIASRSRTGWVQIALLVAWGLLMHDRAGLRISRGRLLTLGAVFAAGVLLWPWLCDLLLLPSGRPLNDQMQAGIRLPFWWSMLDAISREPLFGYGWMQIASAQQRVALDHPAIGSMFDHSHNIVLDLLLWNGIPIGGLILFILASWFILHIRACKDARVVWLLAGVGEVFVHGLLEYPLTYAYFLIPIGLAMGAIERLSPALGASASIPRKALLLFTVAITILFLTVATNYFHIEETYRIQRFELAHIGTNKPVTPVDDKHAILTQLNAFLKLPSVELKPGMTPEQLDWVRKVAERYGFSGVLLRYAQAAGLNGQPDKARETLYRLCHIHTWARCKDAYKQWDVLRNQYPQLPAPIPVDGLFPSTPSIVPKTTP